jgi:hypothetical protein
MKSLRTMICTVVTAAVVMVPTVPAVASEDVPAPVVEEMCGILPDLSKWGWHWPC